MTKLLTKPKRELLRQLVLDCTLRRLSTTESLEYIYQKLRVRIKPRYFYVVKQNIVDSSGQQLEYLQKNRNAYLAQYFERIAEQHKFQRELWEIYQIAKQDNDKSMQILCIKELQVISQTLTELYNLLPEIRGLHFESDNDIEPQARALQYEENNPEFRVSGGIEDPEAKF
jgi:hypothetical protein